RTVPLTHPSKDVLKTASALFIPIMCRTGKPCGFALRGQRSQQSQRVGSRQFQAMLGRRGKQTGSWNSSARSEHVQGQMLLSNRLQPITFALFRIVFGLLFLQFGTQKLFGWPNSP